MIVPNLGPKYIDNNNSILSRMEAVYAEASTSNLSYWQEADIDWRIFVGDQTAWTSLFGNVPFSNRQHQFTFNRVRRVINMIGGHQRRTRKSIVVVPIENADNETADQFTKVVMWAVDQEDVLETISDAFEGALVGGMNLLQVWLDYRNDPVSGNIKVDNCSYNSFLIDPYFKKTDLSDCNYIWKRSFLTQRECISLMPEKKEEIEQLSPNMAGNNSDGKFQFMAQSYNSMPNNLLTYDEFCYRDYRKQKMLFDNQTGETMEWKSDDKEGLDLFMETYPSISVIETEIPTVKLAIVIQGKVMYDGAHPLGVDQYCFVPVFAYYAPQIPDYPWRIQGVVRGLRSAQYLYNRRKVTEFDILESQINSGFIYKENALVNPADIFLSGQGKGLALKEEAAMTDIQQIQAPQIPPSMIELSKIMGEEISQVSGVNEELLGSANDDKAGILSQLRQGAGLTTLQILFDQLERSQKTLGRLLIDVIQANFTPGKIQRILGGEQPAPQFFNKAFGKYNAAVEDGLNTETQRQMQFAQMLQLKEMGLPISPADLLEAATLQNKNRIIENMQKAEQQQAQQAQHQMEMQMQLQQAEIELAQARTFADKGLGAERISRIEENKALSIERISESNANQEKAMLDKVKALRELESIDLGHIEKLLAMANALKAQEVAQTQMQPSSSPQQDQTSIESQQNDM